MSDLLTNPLWRPEDLGRSMPDSPHAVSACLPTWADNIGYEEQDPRVMNRLVTGYPRFVYNEFCRRYFQTLVDNSGHSALAFSSQWAAERCVAFLNQSNADTTASHLPPPRPNIHPVLFPTAQAPLAKQFWQHTGQGISSRQAEAALDGIAEPNGTQARQAIRARIADVVGVPPERVFLFSCGMSAIDTLLQFLHGRSPGRPTVQFGFPYVDTLKLQQKLGTGALFYPRGTETDLQALEHAAGKSGISAILTEFPSNPLLVSPDLDRLRRIADIHKAPLVVDDTVASCVNVDLRNVADVVCMSLTKYFSGAGDVTGGALVLTGNGEFAESLQSELAEHPSSLSGFDADVLEANSRDFVKRVTQINATAQTLVDELAQHPAVQAVYYPNHVTRTKFDRFRKPEGGCGGLFSMVLRDPAATTPAFFDRLKISKGPNLGANFSLACPYTILAHYDELDFVESCGVSRYLIRVSVGLEPASELHARFQEAFGS